MRMYMNVVLSHVMAMLTSCTVSSTISALRCSAKLVCRQLSTCEAASKDEPRSQKATQVLDDSGCSSTP